MAEIPSKGEIIRRAFAIAGLAINNNLGGDGGDNPHPAQAMIAGASWIVPTLECALLDHGIEPVHAFSVRESVETQMPDGTVKKSAVFKHAGFVPHITRADIDQATGHNLAPCHYP